MQAAGNWGSDTCVWVGGLSKLCGIAQETVLGCGAGRENLWMLLQDVNPEQDHSWLIPRSTQLAWTSPALRGLGLQGRQSSWEVAMVKDGEVKSQGSLRKSRARSCPVLVPSTAGACGQRCQEPGWGHSQVCPCIGLERKTKLAFLTALCSTSNFIKWILFLLSSLMMSGRGSQFIALFLIIRKIGAGLWRGFQ